MASGQQPEVAIDLTHAPATPELGNDSIVSSNTHGGGTGELVQVNSSTGQESIDSSSTRYLLSNSHESNVSSEFKLLWRLRKYLMLLGILAVSVTYNAGLTPPGGFWTNNTNGHDAHDAGDPILRAKFFPRHEVFFYFNATAFAASLVLIILLLSKHVTRKKLWLRSMQLTMILDLFSLMGAYAAGSCRAVKSSIYIWVLVFAVFLYIVIHILVFMRLVRKFVPLKRFVPHWLKQKAKSVISWIQSKCNAHGSQRSNEQEKDVEEARKFILMLVTFAATVAYQAGLGPPGGFWAENDQKKDPATSMLRSKNLARYNTFVICNSTSFVTSLVTIILLLSTKLSKHGIRSKAMLVCVVVDLLGLIGAYAAGSCRSMKTSVSVLGIIFVVWILFALLAGTFLHKTVAIWLKKIKPDVKKCIDTIGRALSFGPGRSRSRTREGDSSIASRQQTELLETAPEPDHHPANGQKVANIRECEPLEKHQGAGKQETANAEEIVSTSVHALVNDKQSENSNHVVHDLEGQSTGYMSAKDPICRTENLGVEDTKEQSLLVDETPNIIVGVHNLEHQSADNLKDGSRTGNSLSTGHPKPRIMTSGDLSEQIVLASSHNGGSSNLKDEKDSSEEPLETNEIEIAKTNDDTSIPVQNGNIQNYEGAPRQYSSNGNGGGNPTDEHLKKSRTYLLLLAILAVSLTYQSGLNPPGAFWSKRENNNSAGDSIPKDTHRRLYHLPGDPILEDTHHKRYIAFFYLNAIAFVASLVMIIMLLNRRMSNKAIKRHALQTAMIVDLLALTGSYVMGSNRKTMNSICIFLLLCLVFAYVTAHVLIAIHWIPEGWKKLVEEKLDCLFGPNQGDDANENWERRRNLLLMLAVLAATVTYQAGMNPPGGVWSDDKDVSGRPGDPILQHNNLKRYDVFYYSNSVSFVSSVAVTILLVNKKSCEHGIKFYALRVCLVVGLVGLLVAYSAGSCRKMKESVYLIIIAVVVLLSLVIQFLLSSTYHKLGEQTGKFIYRWLDRLFGEKEATQETTSRQQDSSGHQEKKVRKRNSSGHQEKKVRKRHKYLILLAILAASITYQAGLNPPGGFWSDDNEGHVEGNSILNPPGSFFSDNKGHLAGNPILLDINPRRYEIFFFFNSISFMASIVVIMFLLNDSVRKKDLPLDILHGIMIVDLLALMTAFAAGSCRKFRTSVYVYLLVGGVVIYLVIVIFLSSGIAKYLCPRKTSGSTSQAGPDPVSTDTPVAGQQL